MPANLIGISFADARLRTATYAVLLAVFLGALAAITASSWQRQSEVHGQNLEIANAITAKSIDIYLLALERSIATLGERLQRNRLGAGTTGILADFQKHFPHFSNVLVISTEGDVLYASRPARPGDVKANVRGDPSFQDAYERLASGQAMVIGRPFFAPLSKEWLSPLRHAVRDSSGKMLYILSAGLSLDRPHEFWEAANLPDGGHLGLVRDDGYMVARFPAQPSQAPDPYLKPLNGLLDNFLGANPGMQDGIIRGDSPVVPDNAIVAFSRIKRYGVTVFRADRTGNLYAAWWATVWPAYLFLLLFFAYVAAIFKVLSDKAVVTLRAIDRRAAPLETANVEPTTCATPTSGSTACTASANTMTQGSAPPSSSASSARVSRSALPP